MLLACNFITDCIIRHRRKAWITPCKRSAARGKRSCFLKIIQSAKIDVIKIV